MVIPRWTALVPLMAGAAAIRWPQVTDITVGTRETTAPATSSSTDIAANFVSSLIFNATQIDEAQRTAKRGLKCQLQQSSQPLVVDVDYAKYQGYSNTTTGLNYWKGIRYASAPTGNMRWKPPRRPVSQSNAPITPATAFGPICARSLPSVPGLPFVLGNEDCLFLNVYAPANAQNLPVLVYIHGGGYGYGDGTQDMTEILNANGNSFIAVTIQYRLGAFGFLSSQEVKNRGVVNAGILDQAFALAWIKSYICKFGGDPSSITIAGESAGGGSVMYHDLAVNGGLGTLLFTQSIAASPYLPFQYKYNDSWPTSRYYSFSQAAGCPSSGEVFDCLVSKDTDTLQQANYAVTQQQTYGYWAFYPVTDNVYIQNLATQQMNAKKVNGKRLLVGNNANEGPLFVPPVISTQDDLFGWLHAEFPNLSDAQINSILANNPNNAVTDPAGPRFETDGLSPPTAVNISQSANGQQQRGNNIYAEATFVCPSYWMASAYTGGSKQSWHYQYSVPFAWHASDISAYFGPQTPNQSNDFVLAFRKIWGNFVTGSNPSISNTVANGASSANPNAPNDASAWPVWTESSPKQLNLNETGGTPYQYTTAWGSVVTQYQQPGLLNAIAVVAADTWEGGRGSRCDLYKSLAPSIPA